jgi:hypothetical protein
MAAVVQVAIVSFFGDVSFRFGCFGKLTIRNCFRRKPLAGWMSGLSDLSVFSEGREYTHT